METLGHYAATTPLREQESTAAGSQAGAAVRAFSGIDLVTGMPVVVYRFAGPLPLLPSSLGENIPTLLEAAEDSAGTHLVYAAVPGLSPLVPPLTGDRLAWAARSLASALSDAHAAGFTHGNLRPAYLRARGNHLLLYGVGLPWPDDRDSSYRAPEGPGTPAADVFAAGRVLRELAGDPLSPELNALLDTCTATGAAARPSASQLRESLQGLPAEAFEPPRRKSRSKSAIPVVDAPAAPAEVATREEPPADPPRRQEEKHPPKVPAPTAQVSASAPAEVIATPQASLVADAVAASAPIPAAVGDVLPDGPPESVVAAAAEAAVSTPVQDGIESPSPDAVLSMAPAELEPAAAPDSQPPSAPNRKKGRKVAEPVKIGSFSELPTVYEATAIHKAPVTETQPAVEPAPPAADPPRPWREAALPPRKRRTPTVEKGTDPSSAGERASAGEVAEDLPVITRRTGDSDGSIRIGFQDDDSWRSVKVPHAGDGRGGAMSRQSLVLIALAALLTVAIGIALFMLLRSANDGTTPTVPAASRGGVGGLVVTFKLEATDGTSTAGKAGRLIALKVPTGSGLQAGDVLATVPGPVLFPVAGEYSLRIRLEGYQAQDFALNVQDNRDVVIRLDQTER